ncbi:MAG: sigma-70 family RNA polymerase sigma factor [Planctomycetaceae bacterium]
MNTALEFQSLLNRAADGDTNAMADLARRYEPEVRIVARARLSRQLRPYLDSMDITQSVHRSLMTGLRAGKFDIATPEKLIGLAVTIVRRKIAKRWRKLRRQTRDSHFGTTEIDNGQPVSTDSAGELVDAEDQFRFLVDGLSDTDRRLVELRMAGHNTAEAARRLGMNPDVVRVRLSRLRSHLRDRLDRQGRAR